MSSAEGRRAGGMWLKGLDISSDFLGYTVSGDAPHLAEEGFNSATRRAVAALVAWCIGEAAAAQRLWAGRGGAAHCVRYCGGGGGEARAKGGRRSCAAKLGDLNQNISRILAHS